MIGIAVSGSSRPAISPDRGSERPLLEIRDLRVSFGGVRAIDGVEMSVFEREIVGVIGPNGSGKTTTFNVVTGLIKSAAGSVRWDGQRELVGADPWTIYRLGIARTFQNIRLPLGLSVLDNVMLGLFPEQRSNWLHALLDTRYLKERTAALTQRAEEALHFVSPTLSQSPNRLVAELSYADRRRVEIARAIVSKPRLLLLDEPTAGMNAGETDELAKDITKVSRTGVTIVLVEHKMKFISELADRVVVLNFGKKIAEDSYENIRTNGQVIDAYLGTRRAAQA
jgi:ABC-type branched-subunit amino acid transport system ATPase component